MAGHRGDERELHRRRLPAVLRLSRDEDAAAGRRVRRGDREPPPALRRRVGAAERLRRGDSVLPLRDRGRGAPARGRRDAVLRHRGEQLPLRRLRARRRSRDLHEADPRPRGRGHAARRHRQRSRRRAPVLRDAPDAPVRRARRGREPHPGHRAGARARRARCRGAGARAGSGRSDDRPHEGRPGRRDRPGPAGRGAEARRPVPDPRRRPRPRLLPRHPGTRRVPARVAD